MGLHFYYGFILSFVRETIHLRYIGQYKVHYKSVLIIFAMEGFACTIVTNMMEQRICLDIDITMR